MEKLVIFSSIFMILDFFQFTFQKFPFLIGHKKEEKRPKIKFYSKFPRYKKDFPLKLLNL